MANARVQRIELQAGVFRYREWGARGRPIVLLHGAGWTCHQWDMVAPILAQSRRVLAPDLRGHGESAQPDEGYDFRSDVNDVKQFKELLTLDAPIVVGHSWGASIALQYAAQEPDECAAVVLVDGGIFDSIAFRTWDETEQALKHAPQLDGVRVDTFLKLAHARYAAIWSAEVEKIVLANFLRLPNGAVRSRLSPQHRLKIARSNYDHNPSALYEHVRCPVLIILPIESTEAKDAPRWNEHRTISAQAAQRGLPTVQVKWLDGCSHDVPLERPKELAEATQRFLSALRL